MKKLSGKKFFYWLGVIHFNKCDEWTYYNKRKNDWPEWAKREYLRAIT